MIGIASSFKADRNTFNYRRTLLLNLCRLPFGFDNKILNGLEENELRSNSVDSQEIEFCTLSLVTVGRFRNVTSLSP